MDPGPPKAGIPEGARKLRCSGDKDIEFRRVRFYCDETCAAVLGSKKQSPPKSRMAGRTYRAARSDIQRVAIADPSAARPQARLSHKAVLRDPVLAQQSGRQTNLSLNCRA
jgi:hypothetical protein